jgi:hypothetical protein
MEAVRTSETAVYSNEITRRYIAEGLFFWFGNNFGQEEIKK